MRVDHRTADYFDQHGPEYSPRRLDRAIELIRDRASEQALLVDIGCGTGNVLAYLSDRLELHGTVGFDVSARCVQRARETTTADVFEGSIMDNITVARLAGRFDVAVMSAVLHHLVCGTRARSRAAARAAVANAVRLLRPGGHLVIVEPTFTPAPAVATLFWIKRLASWVTTRRLTVGGAWNNLGAPVVSFYSPDQIRVWAREAGAIEVFETEHEPLSRLAAALFTKTTTTLVIRRAT
jgi:SAM-dependent methyltransferase